MTSLEDGNQRTDISPPIQSADSQLYESDGCPVSNLPDSTNSSVNGPFNKNTIPIMPTENRKWNLSLNFIRQWLVIPMCLLYFGAYMTSFLTMQQFVYVKIQRDKYPNVTFNTSTPVCDANESDPNYKIQTEVQTESADWMTYFTIATGIPAVFSDLILGSSTDKFGRKFLFFLPCIGLFIHLVINVVGIYTDFALYWYIVGCIIEGLTGQMFALLLVTFSYIADITSSGKRRSFGIVIAELAIGAGITAFAFAAGYMIQSAGFFWTMLSAAVYLAITLILVIVLPQTYAKEKRQQTSSAWNHLFNAFRLFFGKSNSLKKWTYRILLMAFVFSMFTMLGRGNVETLYQLNNPFCWDPKHVSWFIAVRSGSQMVIGMVVVKMLQKVVSDEVIAMVGCFSVTVGYVLEGLSTSDPLLYAG